MVGDGSNDQTVEVAKSFTDHVSN
ncbi:hypothetical protein [Nostoc flagelliforme]